jgi:protein tyrosine phosphatase (PTP) superfamily phosphohydrolase (DUF442 family)
MLAPSSTPGTRGVPARLGEPRWSEPLRNTIRVGVTLLMLGSGLWLWTSGPVRLRDRVIPRRLVEVESGLFRSGQIDAGLIEKVLREQRIDVVLDLQGPEDGTRDRVAERRAIAALGLRSVHVSLSDNGTGSVEAFATAIAALEAAHVAGQTVLVHCGAGARRTGAVLAAYELLVRGDAVKAERELERFTEPGHGSCSLRSFLNRNLDALAAELVRRGVSGVSPAHLSALTDASE